LFTYFCNHCIFTPFPSCLKRVFLFKTMLNRLLFSAIKLIFTKKVLHVPWFWTFERDRGLLEFGLALNYTATTYCKQKQFTVSWVLPFVFTVSYVEIYKFHSFFGMCLLIRVIHLPYRVKPSNLLLGILFVFELKNENINGQNETVTRVCHKWIYS